MSSASPAAGALTAGAAPTRRRLLSKIVGGVAVAILVIEVILLVPSLVAQRERLRAPRITTARVLAHALVQPLRQAMLADDPERAFQIVAAAATDPYVYMVILVDRARTTVACSVTEHIGLPHRGPAVEQVMAPGGPDEASHEAGTTFAYARAIRRDDGAAIGALEVAIDMSAVPRELVAFALRTFGVVLIILLFTGCVIGLYLYVIVLKPVWRIVRANVAAARGDHAQAYVRAEEIPDDELGDIARTRNEMLAAIEAHSQDLEAMVVRGISDPVALLDADRRVLLRNRPGEPRMTGGPASDGGAPRRGCECEVHRLKPEMPFEGCPAGWSLRNGLPTTVALAVESPEGRRFLEASAYPLADPLRVIELVRDVTERHTLEAVARRNERLAVVGELAAGMAHEIRNPLASIVASADLLVAEPDRPLDAEGQTLLGILKKEARRINRLLSDFLQFARPRPPRLARTDLNAVVGGVAELARTHPKNGGRVEVRTTLDPAAPGIEGDADLLEQALLNVAINGLEAMPEGGRLSLATARRGDGVEITVADTGVGIGEAERNRIFEPFHTTKPEGTGLGLAITYRIVQGHGGTIAVDGAPGAGTTVRIRLPAAQPGRAPGPAPATAPRR